MAAIYAAQGCDAASLKAKGFDAHAVFWHAGFSVPSLKAAGYSAKQLKEAEIDATVFIKTRKENSQPTRTSNVNRGSQLRGDRQRDMTRHSATY